MDKKKILFLVPLPPPVHGSAVMSQQIVDSKIIRENIDCDFVNIATSRTMGEISRFTLMKPLRHLSIFMTVFVKLLLNKYDACYIALTCHGKGFLKDAPFALLCKAFGKRLIIHQHNKGMSTCIGRNPYKWLIPLVYKDVSVILLSWRLFDDIKPSVDKGHVLICPNGIPDLPYSSVKKQNEVPHILFLSNLIKSKGVLDLLDACVILKRNHTRFICDFVGKETAEITKELFVAEIQSRGLENYVIYHGPQYGESKERILSSSDIFLLPSANDAFPLVILEAMQYSIPVISYPEGGVPDIVEDNKTGFIVPKHDVPALAAKIEYLISHSDVAKTLGMAGLNKFNQEFRLEIWEKRMCHILKSICS